MRSAACRTLLLCIVVVAVGACSGDSGGDGALGASPSPAEGTPTPSATGAGAAQTPGASPTAVRATPSPEAGQTPLPTRPPTERGVPTAVLRHGNRELAGKAGSNCWQETSSRPAICSDEVGFPESEGVLEVEEKAALTLYFTRPQPPSQVTAQRYEAPSFRAPKHDVPVAPGTPYSMTADFPPGEHWLEVTATWQGHGRVPYYFHLAIRPI